MNSLDGLIDLDRYPIAELDSKQGRELLAECHSQLRDTGACLLHNFVPIEAIETMVTEVEALVGSSHHYASSSTTVYQETVAPEEESSHPRQTTRTSSNHVLAYDLIPRAAGLRRLYESDVFLEFISRALCVPNLHRYADELGALNVAVNMAGDHNGWHFDQCDFVTSLLLREAEEGGVFEYVPRIRDADNENYDAVKRILDGHRDAVVTAPLKAGSLSIFKGRHSIHRVTKIAGEKPRLIGLLGYDAQAGVVMTESASRRRFGRVARRNI